MRRARSILVAALTLLVPCAAHAETLAEIFEDANAAYYRGDYDAAARGYRRLVAAGVVDPDVATTSASRRPSAAATARPSSSWSARCGSRPGTRRPPARSTRSAPRSDAGARRRGARRRSTPVHP
ncbi:MAG: hypothetical protein M5U28_25600 [Sandaracinaceae bacterium]|nr:hypothetical protein [Sandaracinaceae bacterium]